MYYYIKQGKVIQQTDRSPNDWSFSDYDSVIESDEEQPLGPWEAIVDPDDSTKIILRSVTLSNEELQKIVADQIRPERDSLLLQSDWTQANDSPLSESDKAKWAEYRKKLRDLTSGEYTEPSQVPWPEEPS